MKSSLLIFFSLLFHIGLQAQQIVPDGSVFAASTITPVPIPRPIPTSAPVNYIRTWQLQKPVIDTMQIKTASSSDAIQQTQYFDGLGQTVQIVSRGISPEGKDLVTASVYDAFGREAIKYLPYVSSSSEGNLQTNPFSSQAAFMQDQYNGQGERFFYSNTKFDSSSLNRITAVIPAGNSWVGSGRGNEFSFQFNEANEVRIWTIPELHGGIPVSTGYYESGQLDRTVNIDENGKRVIEYKDKGDNLILRKVQLSDSAYSNSHTGWLCTYYVYDDFDQLRAILPPKAVEQSVNTGIVTDSIANGLCFRYEYDTHRRIINKKIPGAAESWIIYDARDRIAFTQDGNMQKKNWWLATLYDHLNRPVITGIMHYNGTYEQLVSFAANPDILGNKTNINIQGSPSVLDIDITSRELGKTLYQASVSITFEAGFETENSADFVAEIIPAQSLASTYLVAGSPLPSDVSFTALTQNYYDTYTNTQRSYNSNDISELEAGNNSSPESVPVSASQAVRGLPTGNKVWLMLDSADLSLGKWLETTNYYDALANPVQTQSNNDKGGLETLITRYDFSGKIISTYQIHHNPESSMGEVRVGTLMNYDAQGRLLSISKKINNGHAYKIVVQNDYDELGQLKIKHLGEGLQDIKYEYNIRGWLKSINKDYVEGNNISGRFGQSLSYDFGFTKPQFDGKISGVRWRSAGDGEQRAYGFDYDNADRLLKADFTQYNSGWNNNAGVDFSVKMGDGSDPYTAYDANGNIKSVSQKGLMLQSSNWIDSMKYTYFNCTNQLQNIVDYKNNVSTKLGDFRTSSLHPQKSVKDNESNAPGSVNLNTIIDYGYDVNGNMLNDLNKDITTSTGKNGINYNYLNLPVQVTVKSSDSTRGIITYVYDATGSKHQKITREFAKSVALDGISYNSDITTTTSYEGPFVYERKVYSNPALHSLNTSDQLQFIAQEEGRIRLTENDTSAYAYDYFIKDHLGNIRMVLTDEKKIDKYPIASLENVKVNFEAAYYRIDSNQIVVADTIAGITSYLNDNGIGNNPVDTAFRSLYSQKLYKLNALNARTGLGITLKVMAGDRLDVFGKSYYNHFGNGSLTNSTPISLEILEGLLNGINGNVSGSSHTPVTASSLNGLPGTMNGIGTLLFSQAADNSQYSDKPKAYINYLFFDEQFNCVGSGFSSVGSYGTIKDHRSELQNISVPKNGYVYIYCSNESPINVFFDNIQVVHTRGPELEETHYYPFGLSMAGISSKAAGSVDNRRKYNGIELENDLELQTYTAFFRELDPQIARWWQLDPETEGYENLSPYISMYDNPMKYSDPLGNEGENCCWDQVKAVTNFTLGLTLGAAAGTIDNVTGSTNLRDKLKKHFEGTGAAGRGWNAGLDVADVGGVLIGASESVGGGAGMLGSGAVTIGTDGLIYPVTATSAALSSALTIHGAFTGINSARNLINQRGRVDATSHSSESGHNSSTGQSRSKNKRKPDPAATGDHTVINREGATTFEKNRSGKWSKTSNIDKTGKAHFNKKTKQSVSPPHRQGNNVNGEKIPGGVEPVDPNKMPKYIPH